MKHISRNQKQINNGNKIFNYHIYDTRNIKSIIKEKIVDVIITSPPYWNLKNYNVEGQIGYGQKYEDYLKDLGNIFNYFSKIVKDTGSLWIIIDTFKKDGEIKLLPFDITKKIQKNWKLQDIIIWNKDKTLPWSTKGRLRNIFEYILFFTKVGSEDFKYYIDRIKISTDFKKWWVKYPERYNPNGKTPHRLWEIPLPEGEIWKFPIPTQGAWGNGWVKHACPFPPKLVERILLLTTDEGDVVLDPFAGSGSVLAQARVMNRKAIGFDINPDFKRMYEEKVYPEIKRMWNIRKKELKEEKYIQAKLRDTIYRLRKLKYPKDLIKESIKIGLSEEALYGLNSILILDRQSSDPQIYLVYDNKIPDKTHFTELWKTIDKIPEWKYGFKPKPKIIRLPELIKDKDKLGIPSKLYLYPRGRTNYFESNLSFDEWIKKIKSEDWKDNFIDIIPPIVSNIEVREKVRESRQITLN